MTTSASVLTVDGIVAEVAYRDIGNLYIRVLPPDGRVRVSAPRRFDEARVRSAVTERRDWILRHRERIRSANPDVSATLTSGDVLHLWGASCRLEIARTTGRPAVTHDADRIILAVPDGTPEDARRRTIDGWYRERMRAALPGMIAPWEARMAVTVPRVTIRRMTTRWGSCNTKTRRITLNLDLATRDPLLLEYVIVHEMTHYFEPGHGPRFRTLMDGHLPDWRERRSRLNGGSG